MFRGRRVPGRQTRMLDTSGCLVGRERRVHVAGESSSGRRAHAIFHEARFLGSASRMVCRGESFPCSHERLFCSARRIAGIFRHIPFRNSRIDGTRQRICGIGRRMPHADARMVGTGRAYLAQSHS